MLAIQPDLAVVHDELWSLWGGSCLVREIQDVHVVDAEGEAVFLGVEIDGKIPAKLSLREPYRVDCRVVEAPKIK